MIDKNRVPKVLLERGRFCCWRFEERDGKKTKIPYNPRTGERARSNDETTFGSFDEAVQAVKDHSYDGIGICITNGICAIDLDHCFTDSGYLNQTASEIQQIMEGYVEVSPSGRGIHILFLAENFPYDTQKYYTMNHGAGVEIYVSGATSKYVTFTGAWLENRELADRTDALKRVLERYMCRPKSSAINAINALKSPQANQEDAQLLKSAFESRNGAQIRKLYEGDISTFQSPSEADLALCCHLAFWTARDAAQIDRLFRSSGLMREKWDRAQSGTTYGAITIQKAMEQCTEVYTPGRKANISEFPPVISLTSERRELPEFPVAALPPAIAAYVKAVAESSQTSPDMAAVISLGVLSCCLQGKYQLQVKNGYAEPLNLYTLVVAAPGERKSGVLRSMTSVLSQYEVKYNEDHAEEIRESQRAREYSERKIRRIKRQLEYREDTDGTLMESLIEEENYLLNYPPMIPLRLFADDVSPEALTTLLSKHKGVFSVISAEGGIFDILAGRYSKSPNLDTWLKSHCGDMISVDRVNRDPEYIPHPCLTAILTVQPSILNTIMVDQTMGGRGLLARFLYSFPESRVGERSFHTEEIPTIAIEEYEELVFRLMDIPRKKEAGILTLSPEADALISDRFAQHEQYLKGEGQLFADWAAKFIGTILRISGLLHAAEMSPEDTVVSPETMQRAIEIGDYFLAHALHAYYTMGTDIQIIKARFVWSKIQKMNSLDIKRASLFQNCRGKFYSKAEQLKPELELLEEYGYLKLVTPEYKGFGRPGDVRILVNPAA